MPKERELKKNEYRCAMCKEVFNKGRSDEEALKEYYERDTGIPIEECDLVCDPCYNIIMLDIKRKPWKYGL